MEIETRQWCQTTSLVEPLQRMCILTYLGHDMTLTRPWPDLTWNQIFKLTFQCQKLHISNRLDVANTMVSFLFLYLPYRKSLNENPSPWKRYFFIWWPLDPELLTLGYLIGKRCWGMRRAPHFFRILPSYYASGDNSDCLRKNSYFLKAWPLVTYGCLNIDLTRKWPLKVWDLVSVYVMPFTACR